MKKQHETLKAPLKSAPSDPAADHEFEKWRRQRYSEEKC